MGWYQAMDDNARREWMRQALEHEFDEKLLPKIEALVQERAARQLAEAQYVPPDRRALRYMEQPLSERQLKYPADGDELILRQQQLHDDLYFLSELSPRGIRANVIRRYLEWIDAPDHIRAALTSTTSGAASQWVPTILSADFYTLIQGQLAVAALFPEFEMVGGTVDVPTALTRTRPYLKTEGSAVTEDSTLASGKVTFAAKTLGAFRDFTRELDEDSMLTILPLLRDALGGSIAYGIDLVMLDGDTTATHMDTDIEALGASDCRTAWIGLRKKALTNTGANADLSTWNLDAFNAIPAAMGKYANPSELAIIVGNKVFWKHLPTTIDNSTNKNSVFLPGTFGGSMGPVVNGFTGIRLMGAPIVYAPLLREDVDATGVNGASGNTYTYLVVVNVRAWRRGTRREVTVQYADSDAASIKAGTATVAASWRGTAMHMEGSGLTTAIGYKMS
jgi:HK97 family phage major capsid protein